MSIMPRRPPTETLVLEDYAEWSSTYRCVLCESVFTVDDDSDAVFEYNKGHNCRNGHA